MELNEIEKMLELARETRKANKEGIWRKSGYDYWLRLCLMKPVIKLLN